MQAALVLFLHMINLDVVFQGILVGPPPNLLGSETTDEQLFAPQRPEELREDMLRIDARLELRRW